MKLEERPSMKHLSRIMREQDIATKWYELGLELLENNAHLEVIRADNPNSVQSCCQKMFQEWLDVKPGASGSERVTALSNIKMTTVADAISKKYKTGTMSYVYTLA